MKKIIAIVAAALCFAAVATAQPRTIGLRATYGAELSYQHTIGGTNFLEFDLGWGGNNGFNLAGVYDFIFASTNNFNFYAGPGADLSYFSVKNDEGNSESKIGLGIGGQIGVEYEFSIPLSLSLDWRPMFNFIGEQKFHGEGIALGIRYRF